MPRRILPAWTMRVAGLLVACAVSRADAAASPLERAKAALPEWAVRYASPRPEYQPGFEYGVPATRIVLRRDVPIRFGDQPQQQRMEPSDFRPRPPSMLLNDHVELFLVSGSRERADNIPNDWAAGPLDRVPWLNLEQQSMPVATDLGTDAGLRWYVRGPFEAIGQLRASLRASGGEDAVAFAIRVRNDAATRGDQVGPLSEWYERTRDAAANTLRLAGPAALPKIAEQVDAGQFAVNYVHIVWSMPGDEATALLSKWRHSGDREVAHAAALALVASDPPRTKAKAEILDVLATEPSAVAHAARLVAAQKWPEAVPTLASLRETAETPEAYEAVFRAHRALTGRPVPAEIDAAYNVLSFTGDTVPAGAVAARDLLLQHADQEAAAVVAARLSNWTTKGNTTGSRAIGKAILDALPAAATAEVRNVLARQQR